MAVYYVYAYFSVKYSTHLKITVKRKKWNSKIETRKTKLDFREKNFSLKQGIFDHILQKVIDDQNGFTYKITYKTTYKM